MTTFGRKSESESNAALDATGSIARSFRFAVSLSWNSGRATTVAIVLNPILQGLVPAALALTLRGLINALLANIEQTPAGRFDTTFYIWVSMGLGMALAVSASLQTFLNSRNVEALDHTLTVRLLEHAEKMPFETFEHPDFQDTIHHARDSPGQHTNQIIGSVVRTMSTLATTITLLAVLAAIESRLLLYLLPLAPVYIAFRIWLSRARYRLALSNIRSRRWVHYFTGQLMTDLSLPEARVLRLGPLFISRTNERLGRIREDNMGLHRRELLGSGMFNTFAVVAVHLALFRAVDRAALGELTVGDIAVFAGAASGVRTSVEQFVSGVGQIRWHLAYVEHLQAFFNLPTQRPARVQLRDAAQSDSSGADSARALVVQDVSFTYPGAETPTLDGFSLQVDPGETVALVGRNGTGKSTLVKLISGLYRPDGGSIFVDGLDTNVADEDELRDSLAVVFQHFGQYNATAAENIAMGDWQNIGNDNARVREIAEKVGLDSVIEALPDGYDTLLGRAFGHTSLSGGQWQTFAIARAFAREASLLILDEPTANLDPEAEFEIFEHFKELAHGKATLLISHRFSTLALADRIAVLSEGRIAEQGTQAELIASDGIYARLHRLYRVSGERSEAEPPSQMS